MKDLARPAIAVLIGQYQPPDLSRLSGLADFRICTDDTLERCLEGARALFIWDSTATVIEEAISRADRLEWIHISSTGVDHLPLAAISKSGIRLTNSAGVFDQAVAEYVLALVLAFAKDLRTTFSAQSQGRWVRRGTSYVKGARAVVVGTGPIGREIARLLTVLGMSVAGVGRARLMADHDFGEVHADLGEVVSTADYLIAAAPLTAVTANMFNASVFRAMKPMAFFINVGRGRLVVADDLAEALSDDALAGAALDVFEVEPLPVDSPLWTTKNLVISPHMASEYGDSLRDLAGLFEENVLRWRQGVELRNVVDLDLGYVPGPVRGVTSGRADTDRCG
jgi:phosphoglycerate dehydrogenase-like enzyme